MGWHRATTGARVQNRQGRTHVDIRVSDLDSAAERVVELGGTLTEAIEENGSRFIVMQDPDDNEFCLVLFTPG
ncbi:MAG: VOC family protein [Dehalococcoidia bacterium]|nr:VOC family protein [Dehalococcoidia bacterium]